MVFRMCTLQTCLIRHAKKASSHSSGTSPTKNNENSLIMHKTRVILRKTDSENVSTSTSLK